MSKRLTIEEFIKTLKSGSGSGDSSGGGSGVLCISSEADSSTATAVLDKTWQEIHDALALGTLIIVRSKNVQSPDVDMTYTPFAFALSAGKDAGSYYVNIYSIGNSTPAMYECDTTDGFPGYVFGD